jgi:hypothetical protein
VSLDGIAEEAFLMVTQEHWEDKVVDIPFNPSVQYSAVGGVWKPQSETSSSFSRQLSMGRGSMDSGTAAEDAGLQTSLFPIDNYDLIYRRWEDDIIFEDNSVLKVPQPLVPQLDPNDPNFIIGIPEEPPPTQSGDKDGRKVLMLRDILAGNTHLA